MGSAMLATACLLCSCIFTVTSAEEFCTAGNGKDEASCGSGKIDLYLTLGSPPCKTVLLAAKAVGVELNLKPTDLRAGEHLTPEFLKMNPQHTVPTINDNGFALSESRAIMGYLVDQYAKDDSLYPKSAKKRAVVNQRLYFDIATLYHRFAEYYYPLAFEGASPDKKKMEKLEEAFGFLDKFLEGQEWAAGSSLTIADIALASTVASPVALGFDLKKYKNVNKWFKNCKKSIPDYEETSRESISKFKHLFENVKLS